MLSSGAKKDLMVLSFVNGLINVSREDTTKKDESLSNRTSNKHYKINKKINNKLDKLGEKLQQTVDKLYEIGGYESVVWIRKNMQKRIAGTLAKIQEETINLEMLGIWVLYVNFCETKRPLHDEMKWLTDGDQFLEIADFMEKTNIANIQGEMNMSAYDVIARIKG